METHKNTGRTYKLHVALGHTALWCFSIKDACITGGEEGVGGHGGQTLMTIGCLTPTIVMISRTKLVPSTMIIHTSVAMPNRGAQPI